MNGWRGVVVAMALVALPGCAGLSIGGSRYLARGGPDLTAIAVANEYDLIGPLNYQLHGTVRHGARGREGMLVGGGLDLAMLAGRADTPYLIGGVEVGVGTRDHPNTWSGWSVGLGGQLLALGPLGVRVEGRYRRMTAEDRRGIEAGLRIGRVWRGRATVPRDATRAVPRTVPQVDAAAAGGGDAGATRAAVVHLALEAMGTPYRWGGSDTDGFDCSGLIQYAYGEYGISLPRRSADQAGAGQSVARDPAALLPGDVLTFATQGGSTITHVGLYLGEGRFLHSATGGVQVSALSNSDPYGRWWWQRWVGARRIVP